VRIDSRPALLLLACLLLSAGLLSNGAVERASAPEVFITLTGTLLATIIIMRREALYLPSAWAVRLATGVTIVLLTVGAISMSLVVGRIIAYSVTGTSNGTSATPALIGAAIASIPVIGFVILGTRSVRDHWFTAAAAAYLAVGVVTAHLAPAVIDVLTFQSDASSALIRGVNPYTLTFTDPYEPEASKLFYGPGIAVDGRLLMGFPYPPVSLLLVVPGYLLGDVRFSMCFAMAIAVALVWRAASNRTGRLCALVLAVLSGWGHVLINGWTEPLALALLAAVVAGSRGNWRATPYLLGLLLVTKQYMILILPIVWLLRPAARSTVGIAGFVARAAAAAAVVTVPLALWRPAAFWDSVVRLQFRQPFREDSISLLVWLVNATGWPPPSVYGWLPLVAGTLTACLAAWRAPRTPAAFAGAVGVTLLVTFMVSKQAFTNYYFLAVGALLVAAACWPVSDPRGEP
jgi:hypothetical protein